METTIHKTVKGSTMEQLFEDCRLFSVRYFNATDLQSDSDYRPGTKYRYEIKIRHAEGTNANELFQQAVQSIGK